MQVRESVPCAECPFGPGWFGAVPRRICAHRSDGRAGGRREVPAGKRAPGLHVPFGGRSGGTEPGGGVAEGRRSGAPADRAEGARRLWMPWGRAEAVKLVLEQGFSEEAAAKRLVTPSTLGNWIVAARRGQAPAPGRARSRS